MIGILLILLVTASPLGFVFTSKHPIRVKCFMGGNYLLLLAVITIFLGMRVSFLTVSKGANEDLNALVDRLEHSPAAETLPVLEAYLKSDTSGNFRLSEKLSER